MQKFCKPIILILILFFSVSSAINAGIVTPETEDTDRDGLPDGFEQEILALFLPSFMVSENECAGVPAEFQAGSERPLIRNLNGMIYGQVFPVKLSNQRGAFLEVHYYHLWSRDCGDFGHPLDTEYVSALLRSEHQAAPADDWRAQYWYAAAHEGTLCSAGNGARAEAIGAETKGAVVWISSGKHASFLSLELCRRVGCGGDRCEEMYPMPAAGPINLGEPGFPLNGTEWAASDAWSLAQKMDTDFNDATLQRFEQLPGNTAAPVNRSLVQAKAFLLGGNRFFGAMAITRSESEAAVSAAGRQVGTAVNLTLKWVGKSVLKPFRKLRRSTPEISKMRPEFPRETAKADTGSQ